MMTKIKEGYKETEIGIIPEDWEVYKVEDLSIRVCVGFVGTCSDSYTSETNGVPMIRTTNLKTSGVDLMDLKFVTHEFHSRNKKSQLRKGDILVARHGSNGKASVFDYEFEANSLNIVIIRPNEELINSYYFKEFFNCKLVTIQVANKIGGSVQSVINTKSIATIDIAFPPLPEQQRIAEILSTTDNHIEKLDKIIEDYQLLKKGMMKKLLTEGIGHTEFKETEIGRIPKEWEVVPLSEVAEIVSGGTPKTSISEYWECGDVMWATPTDITSNGKYIIKTEKMITEAGLKNSSATLLPIGTILMTSRATIGERCINKYPMSTNQGFKSFICKENCDNEFLYYYIEILKPEIIKNSSGSTFLEISKSKIEVLLIALPRIQEQKSIAEILSGIDEIIYCFGNERFEFLQLKKYLMEKLLTGKVRV